MLFTNDIAHCENFKLHKKRGVGQKEVPKKLAFQQRQPNLLFYDKIGSTSKFSKYVAGYRFIRKIH